MTEMIRGSVVSILSTNGSHDLNLINQFWNRKPWRSLCALRYSSAHSKFSWIAIFIVALLIQFGANAIAQDVTFKRPDVRSSVAVSANKAERWKVGQYEVLHLIGNVRIEQQLQTAAADEAILWVETPGDAEGEVHKVIAYLEGQVVIDIPRGNLQQGSNSDTGLSTDRIIDEVWLGRFFTSATVDLNVNAQMLTGETPAIFTRAQSALETGAQSAVQQVGFTQQSVLVNPQTGAVQQIEPVFQQPVISGGQQVPMNQGVTQGIPPFQGQAIQGVPGPNNGQASQSITGSPFSIDITNRDAVVGLDEKSFVNPQNPNERIRIFVGGIRISIDSKAIANLPQFKGDQDRRFNILADNLVNWQVLMPDGTKRNQLYLEGNVVFAKGSRVIYAERMFYDVEAQQGTILDAEVITTVPSFAGAVRLKADVVQQYDENNLQAFGSAITSSRLGVPRYWLQSESVAIQGTKRQALDPLTGGPLFEAGQPKYEDEFFVDGQQNRVFLGGVPVFAWPRIQTSLSDPTLYLDRLGVNNDSIFGFQLTTGWNMYQVLGFKAPPQGTRWIGILDYLSERGLAFGSEFDYTRNSLFGVPGLARGQYKSWFINDDGRDFLGLDRPSLLPEKDMRGRIAANHRHDLGLGYTLRAEVGYISDRNFLEQYYEREWDTQKDATTGFWLERNQGTRSNNLTADLQLNEFFTQTSGIKFDQFVLGQPVFNNRAIWHSHSHAGYVRMRQAEAPLDPVDLAKFDPLAWETDVDGIRAGTRHELDFPIQLGPVKVVAYGIGDVTYWKEDLTGGDLTRAYGQVGIKASLPMWRVDPSVQSVLWNVNGLAHKVNFDVDAFYSDASQDLNELPLYDQLDDDSQEHFRRRFAFDTFGIAPGGDVPLKYDERFYAFRSGMQGNITAPSAEIADDLAAVKLGLRQRWQTKRGMPGRERIIDWMTLDMQTILFPNAQRDNFGSADFGMFDYDFKWHLGDRFSVLSDGYADFFSQGLRTVSVGANIGRPEVGHAYVGYRMIEGPISSNILSAALTYRMSDKWGVKAGGQVDFGATGSIGQSLNFVYIGESFLWQFGANYDVSRDNLGFRFGFEPRFIKDQRLFRPGGVAIPPAGSRWLE